MALVDANLQFIVVDCINIQYKFITLNQSIVVSGANDGLKLTNKHKLLAMLMCPPSENASSSFPDAACMLGSCRSCNYYEASIHEHYIDLDNSILEQVGVHPERPTKT